MTKWWKCCLIIIGVVLLIVYVCMMVYIFFFSELEFEKRLQICGSLLASFLGLAISTIISFIVSSGQLNTYRKQKELDENLNQRRILKLILVELKKNIEQMDKFKDAKINGVVLKQTLSLMAINKTLDVINIDEKFFIQIFNAYNKLNILKHTPDEGVSDKQVELVCSSCSHVLEKLEHEI